MQRCSEAFCLHIAKAGYPARGVYPSSELEGALDPSTGLQVSGFKARFEQSCFTLKPVHILLMRPQKRIMDTRKRTPLSEDN